MGDTILGVLAMKGAAMQRISFPIVVCFTGFVISFCGAGEPLTLKRQLRPDKDVVARWPQWKQELHKRLQAKVSVKYEGVPLAEVVDDLADKLGIPIVLRLKTKPSTDTKVAFSGKSLTGSDMLSRLFAGVGVHHALHDRVLLAYSDETAPFHTFSYDMARHLAEWQAAAFLYDEDDDIHLLDVMPFDEVVRILLPSDFGDGADGEVELDSNAYLFAKCPPHVNSRVQMVIELFRNRGEKALWKAAQSASDTSHSSFSSTLQTTYRGEDPIELVRQICKDNDIRLTVDPGSPGESSRAWPDGKPETVAVTKGTPVGTACDRLATMAGQTLTVRGRTAHLSPHSKMLQPIVLGIHRSLDLTLSRFLSTSGWKEEHRGPSKSNFTDLVERVTTVLGCPCRCTEQQAIFMYADLLIVVAEPRLQDRIADYLNQVRDRTSKRHLLPRLGIRGFPLAFPGGSAEDLATHVAQAIADARDAQARDKKVSVSVSASITRGHGIQLPKIQIQNCTLKNLGQTVSRLLPDWGKSTVRITERFPRAIVTDRGPILPQIPNDEEKYSVELQFAIEGSNERRVYKLLNDRRKHVSPQVAMDLLRATWLTPGSPVRAQMSYQPTTNTLLLSGSTFALRMADEAMATLTGRPHPTREAWRDHYAMDGLNRLQAQMTELSKRLKDLSGSVRGQNVHLELAKVNSELTRVREEMASIKKELKALEEENKE